MNTRGRSLVARTVALALMLAAFGASAAEPAPPEHAQHAPQPAAAPPAGMKTPTPEMRATMAAAHERMAACLRSEKPVADCHAAMQAQCSSMMGGQGCPMMGGQNCAMMGPGPGPRTQQGRNPPARGQTEGQ